MTESLGRELPSALHERLRVGNETRDNVAVILLTSDASDYPRVCLLSPFQVVSSDRRTLFLAVYASSRTAKNLRRSGKGTIAMVTPPSFHYVTGRVRPMVRSAVHGNSFYVMRVAGVAVDDSPEAPITSEVRFEAASVRGPYTEVFRELVALVRKTREGRYVSVVKPR